jgi:4-hydroxy-3-methylbut-2-enyl diphosphate reductase
MSIRDYAALTEAIKARYKEAGIDNPDSMLKVNNTICRQVSGREPNLKNFANSHDIVIFVSGNESSNGKILYQVCKSENIDSHFVTNVEDIDVEWFKDKHTVGICGATSTPKWLIEKVKEAVLRI